MSWKRFKEWLKPDLGLDTRDFIFGLGFALLGYGGEKLHPGAGFTAAGIVMIAVATLVR